MFFGHNLSAESALAKWMHCHIAASVLIMLNPFFGLLKWGDPKIKHDAWTERKDLKYKFGIWGRMQELVGWLTLFWRMAWVWGPDGAGRGNPKTHTHKHGGQLPDHMLKRFVLHSSNLCSCKTEACQGAHAKAKPPWPPSTHTCGRTEKYTRAYQ